MSRSRMLALAATVSMVAGAFGAVPALAQDTPQPPTATPNPVPADVPAGDGTGARITTELGDIVIGLFTESAPVASENFINLAESGYYDGLGFHRVVNGFVIQGGDPAGDGTGGPGYTIKDEEVVGEYGRGIVAMARTQAPDSQGSQFFIVLDDGARAALESANTYVIFGRVIEGMDVVDAIAARGPEADVIEDPVIMQSVTIEQVDLPPEPTLPPPTASELAAASLEARIPTEVGNLTLGTQSVANEEFLRGTEEDPSAIELASIAEANGATIDELGVAIGGADDQADSYLTVLGASIAGVPADEMAAPMIALTLSNEEIIETTQTTIAGKDVTLITAAPGESDGDKFYVISEGDTVWFLVGDAASVETAIGSLG